MPRAIINAHPFHEKEAKHRLISDPADLRPGPTAPEGLNVAISRAQCLAVLVICPRLLDADCPSLEAMELVDGVCRFVEMAQPVALRDDAPLSRW
jgi:hypothetical protein